VPNLFLLRPGLGRATCVRTVRSGPGIGLQEVGADGRDRLGAGIVRIVGDRPRRVATKPLTE
jgi:hypothetical protein